MLFVPLLCLLGAFVLTRLFIPRSIAAERQGDRETGRLYTFVVDPLTMVIVAFAATLAFFFKRKGTKLSYEQFRSRKRLLDLFLLLFIAVFWSLEVMTYFNVMGHPFDHAKTGNDFMWNGYVEWLVGSVVNTTVPTYRSIPMTALAAVLMMLQLPCLLLGRRLAFMTAFFNDLDNWSRPKTR